MAEPADQEIDPIVDIMFLGYPYGFDYRNKRDVQGSAIIELTRGTPLPFRIHCFGHHIVFDQIGQEGGLWKLVQLDDGALELHRTC
jgi:hypothetical protein